MASDLDILGRLCLAAVLGGLLGAERELGGQDAGFRTHLLLSLGAGLFGAASVEGFAAYIESSSSTNVQVDVTRVASYVAAGIGFLGGGAITKEGHTVRGITTAASIWTTAAVGLSAGIGFWVGATATTAIALFALAGLRPVSAALHRRANPE
jgi:putative Mg2+ transporter-C (MgtC) family protein